MRVSNPPIGIAVIGMPRSGSTIVTSLLNSFNQAAVFGEPHRSYDKPTVTEFPTRYGPLMLEPRVEVLGQIEKFAMRHRLEMFGFKEVLDPLNNVLPIEIVEGYGERLDYIFVTVRDPRRNYSSLVQLGHAKSLDMSPQAFTAEFRRFAEGILSFHLPPIIPVVLEKLRMDPMGHIRQVTGWEAPGQYTMQQYSGGGDPHAMKATLVMKTDYRPRYEGNELDEADEYYNAILQHIGP